MSSTRSNRRSRSKPPSQSTAAEDAWNSRDPERVALALCVDSEWRNRTEFLHGREEIKVPAPKVGEELDYR